MTHYRLMTLKTSEADELLIDVQIARRMGVVRRIFPSVMSLEPPVGIVSLCDINTATLQLIMKWMIHHRSDWAVLAEINRTPAESSQSWSVRTAYVVEDAWELEFFGGMDMEGLLRLATACRYLDVEVMKQAVCRVVASRVRGKSVSGLREMFGLVRSKAQLAQEADQYERWLESMVGY